MSLPRKKRHIVQPSSLLCRDKAAAPAYLSVYRERRACFRRRRIAGERMAKKADASTVLEETDKNVESKLLGYLD